jgi:hypothetical protein
MEKNTITLVLFQSKILRMRFRSKTVWGEWEGERERMEENGGENCMMKSCIVTGLSSASLSVIKRRIIARACIVARIAQTRKSHFIFIGKPQKKESARGKCAKIRMQCRYCFLTSSG